MSGLNALKTAARRARNGAWPFLKNYDLKSSEIQSLMDGKSPSYRIVTGQGERALAYQNQ